MRISVANMLLCFFMFGCANEDRNHSAGNNDIYIATTTGMIGDAVQNIVKDKARVEVLMGPGVDPHLYKATQSDLSKLTNADIIFYNGLFLEGKMQEIFEKLDRNKNVVAIGEYGNQQKLLKKSSTHSGELSYDPHIWFDVELWANAIESIANTMTQYDKSNAAFYKQNFESYYNQLMEQDEWVGEEIKKIPVEQRILITSHDAFEYFGRAYNIEVEGLQGISTASDFGLQDVSRLVNKIVERKVKSVFVETSVSDRSLRAVMEGCEERGHHVKIGGTLFSDAMGTKGTEEGTYIGMVKFNVNTIVGALK